MNNNKSRWLIILVIVLLIANTATLFAFWVSRAKHDLPPKGELKDFLVKELNMDSAQQKQFLILREEHRHRVDSLRNEVKQAKEKLFDLAKDPSATDSIKQNAAAEVSKITEKIDLFTLDHFQKVRALCRPDQQKHFDELLHQMTSMLGAPPPPKHPGGPPPPMDGRPEHPDGPPPPRGNN